MKKQNIPPEKIDSLDSDGLIANIDQFLNLSADAVHAEILARLLLQIDQVDFEAEAFPQIIEYREALLRPDLKPEEEKAILDAMDRLKLTHKHLLVISVEHVIKAAAKNQWGLCKNHDFIYLYNAAYWDEVDREEFQKFLGEAAERMGVPLFTARYYQFREQLFKQFMATGYLPTPVPKDDEVLINLLNGTFQITKSGRVLRPFTPDDFMTYQLPFEYNPDAKAPIWEAFLNDVLPDKSRQDVMAEYFGYLFMKHGAGGIKAEKALILYGLGANGKSVVYEVINAMLGSENVGNYSLQSLTNENGYFRAKLANLLLNYASEINGKLESSILKQLVSGEPVEARLPYGLPFILKKYAKLIFNCNELPKDVEHTNAYFRRFLIIPFDVTIPEDKQDRTLHTKIISTELAGVFNWVLEGLNRLLEQQGFSECEAARQAVEQYKNESNSIKIFLDEKGYQQSIEGYQLIKDLYQEYKILCSDDGMIPFKKINFSRQLMALGIRIGRQPGTGQKIAYVAKDGDSSEHKSFL